MTEQQTLDGEVIEPPGDKPDYTNMSYSIHEFDVAWPNVVYENRLAEAAEEALDSVPKTLSEDEAKDLVQAAFDSVYEAASDGGFSLWMTFHDEDGTPKMDAPVFQRSPAGAWCSPDPTFGSTGDNEPSDEFFKAIAHLFEDDEAEWGGVAEDTWEELSGPERELVESLKDMAIQGRMNKQAAILHDYSRWYVDAE